MSKVYDGRSRYMRLFKGFRQIDRFYKKIDEGDEVQLSVAHSGSAQLIADICRQNGAMWIKVAQYLSCRPDLLPMEYIDKFSEFQTISNTSLATTFNQVGPILLQQWQENWDTQFSAFNIVPVASGSIAQVYQAQLTKTESTKERQVAIKVRVPGVELLYEQDSIVLKGLAKCLEPFYKEVDISAIVDEIIATTKAELNFSTERDSMLDYQKLVRKTPVKTPELMQYLCSSQILVTEWVSGLPLQAYINKNGMDEVVCGAIRSLAAILLEDIFVHGLYHGDPHPGNVMLDTSDALVLIDFGYCGRIDSAQRFHYALLMMALMGKTPNPEYQNLFERAGFKAKNPAFFDQVGVYVDSLIKDETVDASRRLEGLLNSLRKNRIILPQGFVGILRVILLLTTLFKKADLDFDAVFQESVKSIGT